jgi:hypothetical protein
MAFYLIHYIKAEIGRQRFGKPPGEYSSGIAAALRLARQNSTHWNIRNISCPDLIAANNGQIPQDIWVNLVPLTVCLRNNFVIMKNKMFNARI